MGLQQENTPKQNKTDLTIPSASPKLIPPMNIDKAKQILFEGKLYSNSAENLKMNQENQRDLNLAVTKLETEANSLIQDGKKDLSKSEYLTAPEINIAKNKAKNKIDQGMLLRGDIYNSIQRTKPTGDSDFPPMYPSDYIKAYAETQKSLETSKSTSQTITKISSSIDKAIDDGKIAKATGILDAFLDYQKENSPNFNINGFRESVWKTICDIE